VSSFVNGGRVSLVVVHHEALSFGAHQNAISRNLDVLASTRRRIVASRRNRASYIRFASSAPRSPVFRVQSTQIKDRPRV
jgi:hypothetical protein